MYFILFLKDLKLIKIGFEIFRPLKSKTRFDRNSSENKTGSDRINLKNSDDCNKLSSDENLKNNVASNSNSGSNSSK